ncbi:hypothetical protein BGZ74_004080 [Mortierella antarctica]|nr:hypothetical protein BGZ74_004080 [Mortierella antarctica]
MSLFKSSKSASAASPVQSPRSSMQESRQAPVKLTQEQALNKLMHIAMGDAAKHTMLVKNLAIVACLASAAMAQAVGSIFCQARYITNVATCVIGVTECNAVERFSSCVCANTQNKPLLRQCMIALLRDPAFVGTLRASDYLL